jgi:oligogalacturonide lyase
LGLESGDERVLHTVADPISAGSFSVAADGQHIYMATTDKSSVDFPLALGTGYVGFRELFEIHPHCQILRVCVDSAKTEVVHEEDNWITHVNTSPTRKDLLSFCHEGPWNLVAQRMWGLNTDTGEVWKIREQEPEEAFGHEYWLSDGETLGYHGHSVKGHAFGFIRHDNTEQFEPEFSWSSNHFFSNTRDLIVGDGSGGQTPYVLLWRREGDHFSQPRILTNHRCSRHIQRTHVHPRFSADGKQVLYTSDHTGYGQVYLVDIPDFESLSELES